MHRFILAILALSLAGGGVARGAEVVTLNQENFDQAAAAGNEADAIYGDYSISNDRIVAVIANPELIGGRSTSRSSPQWFDGCIIDFTLRSGPGSKNDRLAWFGPGPRFMPKASDFQLGTANYNVDYARAFKPITGKSASFTLRTIPWKYQQAPAAARYTIEDGWRYLLCETIYSNPVDRPLARSHIPVRAAATQAADKLQEIADGPRDGLGVLSMPDEPIVAPPAGPITPGPGFGISVDGVVERGVEPEQRLTWIYNRWQGQAYGVLDAAKWTHKKADGSSVEYDPVKHPASQKPPTLQPGDELIVPRKFIVGRDLFEVRSIANEACGVATHRVKLTVTAPDGPVENADVAALFTREPGVNNSAGKPVVYGTGRTDAAGVIEFDLPAGNYDLRVEALGRKAVELALDPQKTSSPEVKLDAAGHVSVKVTNEQGEAMPCKIEFRGREGTGDQFFGPETGDRAVGNLRYAENGVATQVVAPGKYDVIVTRGPEYDMLSFPIEATPGVEVKVAGKLVRSVDTTGWISADFHAYSTLSNKPAGSPPSAASTMGRVLNMIAEQVEFVPTTELNKVFTYEPLLAELGAERWMKSCAGVALNDGGRKYAYNEQYAFPIVYKERWQDGGAPQRPQHCGQIEWLRSWGVPINPDTPWAAARQVGYEKLIILMQPDNDAPKVLVRRPPVSTSYQDRDVAAWWNDESALIRPMFRDTDGDGVLDHVHQNFASMDALDVRTLAPLMQPGNAAVRRENDVVDWMLMRQNAYRMTGVITSGATHNFHGSGGVRNYVRSATDDPMKIEPLNVARAVKAGQVVMTTGPFMDVRIEGADGKSFGPGEMVASANGEVTLNVKIQCPNWITIDTVRVLLDNQRDEKLEFTRVGDAKKFGDGRVQFEQAVKLKLERDTQVMVVALGHGPNVRQRKNAADVTMQHVALANPICVDVKGDGFVPQPPQKDQIEAELIVVRPLLSRPGTPPARVKLVVTNHSEKAVKGEIPVVIKPSEIGEIKGAVEGVSKFAYSLEPEKKMTVEFEVEMTRGAQTDAMIGGVTAQSVMLRIPRDGTPPGVAPARLQLIVDDSPRASVPDGPM